MNLKKWKRRVLLKVFSLVILALLSLTQCLSALSNPPKREFRAAWIATVANIDWPATQGESPSKQKADLIKLLDQLDEVGINVVILQVRPECDAFYESRYEPWSFWLTGRQGKAPEPFYDPLRFAIEEAHKRGMELHAWFNPYRAEKSIGAYPLANNHVVKTHPEWILTFNETDSDLRILNPGIPAVRQHITNVIMDVVTRYDVDGVHFDDYFYPYPPNQISKTNKDYQTYKTYKHGDASDNTISDWRRENVNILMRMISDSIQATKPWIKFGISPFGIYRPGIPPGIVGMDAYDVIYADPLAWLNDHSIDYLTPQLYWVIGGAQDFSKLLTWWADQTAARNRHLYPGHIFGSSFSTNELPNQLNLVRKNSKAQGDVYFSAKHFGYNTLNFTEKLKSDYYRFPALVPVMDWKNTTTPSAPISFDFLPSPISGLFRFVWQVPTINGADSLIRFALYKFNSPPQSSDPPTDPQYFYDVVGGTELSPPPPASSANGDLYFALTAIDRNSNESPLSSVLQITPPVVPQLALPLNKDRFLPDTFRLKWNLSDRASSFFLQVAEDSLFQSVVLEKDGIFADSLTMNTLQGQTTYYWHVAAENPAGRSAFSETFQFTTAFPLPPMLAGPADGESNVPLDTMLTWYANSVASSYRLQLAQASTFVESYMVLDTVVTDTFVYVQNLEPFKRKWYYWRVKAMNEYGSSDWSETFMFRTVSATFVEDLFTTPQVFALEQNYPNPFNPSTTISFTVPKTVKTTITVYNMLGQKVATLLDEVKQPGSYRVTFDASNLAAGVYIYQMRAGSFVASRKMIVIK